MATRGRPPNKGENISFEVKLPKFHYEYLVWLATNSRLGASESDIASGILVRALHDLFSSGYHDKKNPTI